jgi:hypothetical protein
MYVESRSFVAFGGATPSRMAASTIVECRLMN